MGIKVAHQQDKPGRRIQDLDQRFEVPHLSEHCPTRTARQNAAPRPLGRCDTGASVGVAEEMKKGPEGPLLHLNLKSIPDCFMMSFAK